MRRLVLLLCVSLAAAAPTGCSRPHAATHTAGVLRYPLAGDPTTWDPAHANGDVPCELLQNIYAGLVRLDSTNRVAPAVAHDRHRVHAEEER